MIKKYLGDGFIQIAILLSLLRTDLNNLTIPNNEILNYPEVQDILQGQTVAYLPTNFHNQYNSLHSLHAVQNPKHIDDVFFSSIFNNWRFRRLSTNIEAFLVSADAPFNGGAPPPTTEQSSVDTPSAHAVNANAENNNNGAEASLEATTQGELVDANHNSVVFDGDLSHPFPGLGLSKEDLDLIEVLWRQDVDLGVGKEVFDPNLRKELEHERELELHKEQEKRKEAERRERERQQQAQQWLSQNFVRDGETGELMPIAGNNSLSPSSHSSLCSEATFPSTLEEALSFVGELQDNSYGLPPPPPLPFHQQPHPHPPPAATVVAPGNQFGLEGGAEVQYLPLNGTNGHHYGNQSEQERLEQTWKEVVEQIFTEGSPSSSIPPVPTPPTTTTTLSDENITTHNNNPPPPLPPNHVENFFNNPPPSFFQPPPPPPPNQFQTDMDCVLMEPQQAMTSSSSSFSGLASSMNLTRRLLQENSSSSDVNGTLSGLLSNATLPLLPIDNITASVGVMEGLHQHQMGNETDLLTSSTSLFDLGVGGDVSGGDLFNGTDLAALTGALNTTDLLNSTDLLAGLLPVGDLDISMDDAGLGSLPMLEDSASDSAISSMGNSSPEQDVNDTMQLSPFEGLEGATGGSDYDSTSATYSHNGRTHMSTSGSAEDEHYQYSCSSYGSPASVSTNCSTGSNDTEHSSGHTTPSLHHIHHNHTYPTQPGQTPREVKKYAKKDGPRQKGPQSRDRKRAADLKLPYTFEQIVGSPVEEFNEIIAKSKLTDAQLPYAVDQIVGSPVEEFNETIAKSKLTDAQMALMRDIRRRGKNKVAAQNCRKRKLDVLTGLEEQMSDMERTRDKLLAERRRFEQETRQAKERYVQLYQHIFNSLRDEHGRPYDPNQYSLQESSDGNVFLVRKATGSATSPPVPLSLSPPASLSSSSSLSSLPSGSKDCDSEHKNSSSSSSSSSPSSQPHRKKSR